MARCGHDGCPRPAVRIVSYEKPNHQQFRGQSHDCCAVHSRGTTYSKCPSCRVSALDDQTQRCEGCGHNAA